MVAFAGHGTMLLRGEAVRAECVWEGFGGGGGVDDGGVVDVCEGWGLVVTLICSQTVEEERSDVVSRSWREVGKREGRTLRW